MKKIISLLFVIFLVSITGSVYAAENANQEITVYVNDTKIQMDVPPVFIKNRTMVPLRAVFEALGAVVEWDNTSKTATITRNNEKVQVRLDNTLAWVNETSVRMDVPATAINGRILLPVRFISEAIGAKVDWVNETKTVFIYDETEQINLGNLQNGGRYASDGDYNYHVLNDGTLIRENIRTKSQEKISDHISGDLHIVADWIYCTGFDKGEKKVVRLKRNGSDKETVINTPVNSIQIVNGWIYYGSKLEDSLYRSKIDGSESYIVSKNGSFSPKMWFVQNGWVYYHNNQSGMLERVRVDGSDVSGLTSLYRQTDDNDDYGNKLSASYYYRMILADKNYIYLALEERGIDGTVQRLQGLYRMPVSGGTPRRIINRIPLAINMDENWIYMAVKNSASNQLIKANKDGTDIQILNEYKDNDIPISIYIHNSTIYYTLLRGTINPEEQLFQMSSGGRNISPYTWIYGKDYYPIKDILTGTANAHKSLKNFTTIQNYEMQHEGNTIKVFNESKINRFQSLYYMRTFGNNGEWELWIDKATLFSKSVDEKQWSIQDLQKTDMDRFSNTIFDNILPDQEFCNNLTLSERDGKHILSGSGAFPAFMQKLVKYSGMLYDPVLSFIDQVAMEIVINPQNEFIEELKLDIRYYTLDGSSSEAKLNTAHFKYLNSFFNSTYISLPLSVQQSLSARNRAAKNTESGIVKYNEGKYEEAIQMFDTALQEYSKYYIAHVYKGNSFYKLGKYKEAIISYGLYLESNPSDPEVLTLQGMCYLGLGELNNAEELAKKVLNLNKDNISANYLYAMICERREEYHSALEYYEKVTSLDNSHYDSHLRLVSVLYKMGNFTKCIQKSDEFLTLFPNDRELMFIKAQSLSEKGKSNEAIQVFEQILSQNPSSDFVTLTYIAMEYDNLQNYTMAQEYANKAKAVYPNYNLLNHLNEKLIYSRTTTSSQKLIDFIEEYYLYYTKSDAFIKTANELTSKLNNYTLEDVEKLLEVIKSTNDNLTYIITGKEFEAFINHQNDSFIETKQEGDTYYFKIKDFSPETGYTFIEFINNISNPEDKNLIIDLRDNKGGLSSEVNKILDALLPECTASYLIERDGYISQFISGKDYTRFKKIGILVNENTASGSELLALGLKTYLDNVEIIGNKTKGIGVGQIVYIDRMKKYAIFLVNHYWNVMQNNIDKEGISPDIPVEEDDAGYSKAIEEFLKQ